jgi:hypothetical protein
MPEPVYGATIRRLLDTLLRFVSKTARSQAKRSGNGGARGGFEVETGAQLRLIARPSMPLSRASC